MIEPDPGHIAFLDQQSAAFESEREDFRRTYGFDHECTCGLDYSSNKVGLVTECFVRLCSDALDQCAKLMAGNRMLSEALNESLAIANGMALMLQELGHEKELDEFFKTQIELEGESKNDPSADLENINQMLEEIFDESDESEGA